MSKLLNAAVVESGPVLISRSKPVRIASTVVVAVTLLALGLIGSRPKAAVARDDQPSSPKGQPQNATNPPWLASQIRRALTDQHERIINLANQLIQRTDPPEEIGAQLASQPTKIEAAKARLKSAEFAKQAAEFASAEFEKAYFPHAKASAEAEVELARAELDRLRKRVPQAEERRRLIQQAEKGADIDVASLVVAELEEKKAGFQLEQAQAKLRVLLGYTKGVRERELRSQVEKARSDELANRATVALEGSKLTKLQQTIKGRDVPQAAGGKQNIHDRQALAVLDHAIPIEEQLRAKLNELAKPIKAAEGLRHETENLLTRLRATVDQAEIERSAARFDALKGASGSAYVRRGPSAPRRDDESTTAAEGKGPAAASPPAVSPDFRWTLKTQQDRIVSLASRLKNRADLTTDVLADQLDNAEITWKSREANYENAKLTREVAEIAVVEYEEGIFIQDRETLRGERLFALSDRDRKRDRVELAKGLLGGDKRQPKDVPPQNANDPKLVDFVEREKLDLRRAEVGLADVESRLKILEEYTKPKCLCELRCEVEKERADELIKKAEAELGQSTVERLRTTIAARRLPSPERRAREEQDRQMRDSFNCAIAIADQVGTRLAKLGGNVQSDGAAQGQIRELSHELDLLIDHVEQDASAAQFDALKARIHAAAK